MTAQTLRICLLIGAMGIPLPGHAEDTAPATAGARATAAPLHPSTGTGPVEAQWSSRTGNYWLYWLDPQTNMLRACDWRKGTVPEGALHCRTSDERTYTSSCSSASTPRLVVPPSTDNNSVAIVDEHGCVSLCYLKSVGAQETLACTKTAHPFMDSEVTN